MSTWLVKGSEKTYYLIYILLSIYIVYMTILILTPTLTLSFYLIINFQILQQNEYIHSKSPKQIKLKNEFCLVKVCA